MANIDSQNACTFSVYIRESSARSAAPGLAPAASIRAVRMATTCGAAIASSAAFTIDPARLLRLTRRMDVFSLILVLQEKAQHLAARLRPRGVAERAFR